LLVSDFFAHGPDNALPVARVVRRVMPMSAFHSLRTFRRSVIHTQWT
jgi:hypothetical protein